MIIFRCIAQLSSSLAGLLWICTHPYRISTKGSKCWREVIKWVSALVICSSPKGHGFNSHLCHYISFRSVDEVESKFSCFNSKLDSVFFVFNFVYVYDVLNLSWSFFLLKQGYRCDKCFIPMHKHCIPYSGRCGAKQPPELPPRPPLPGGPQQPQTHHRHSQHDPDHYVVTQVSFFFLLFLFNTILILISYSFIHLFLWKTVIK